MKFNFYNDCEHIVSEIKNASWFPYKQGNLKINATQGQLLSPDTYRINFNSEVAPYIEFLEEGTRPHNILGAFIGKEAAMQMNPPFGTYGRFNGKFHPGSVIHKDFIKEKCVKAIVDYFATKYNGEVTIA